MKLFAVCLISATTVMFGAPVDPPTIETSVAGEVVKGKAADARYPIRVKVFSETGDPEYKDGLVDPRDNSFGVVLTTTAGQIVQAYVLVNGEEASGAASRPKLIKAAAVSLKSAAQFTPDLKEQLREGEAVRRMVTIKPAKFGDVTLTRTPQEGQRTLYVSAPPSGTVTYLLAAFINGEQVRVIDASGNETDAVAPSSTGGSTALQLKDPLDGGQCVQVAEFESGKQLVVDTKHLGCPSDAYAGDSYSISGSRFATAFFDFGRIRSYLVAGSLLSFDGGNFSQPSVFLALNANRNWIWGGFSRNPDGSETVEMKNRFMFDTFFEARLTTVPTVACTAANTCSSPSASTIQSALTSPKAAELLTGISMPVILSTWKRGTERYGFTLGPIAKVGFLTPVGSQDATTAQAVSPQSFYSNFGFGTRFGFHKLTSTSDVAPETVSYIDVVSGRFANFDYGPAGDRSRPWRFAFEGLLKVPSTPFFIGFSANVHQNFGLGRGRSADLAPDDLRFLFGAKFDAGKLFDAIGQIK